MYIKYVVVITIFCVYQKIIRNKKYFKIFGMHTHNLVVVGNIKQNRNSCLISQTIRVDCTYSYSYMDGGIVSIYSEKLLNIKKITQKWRGPHFYFPKPYTKNEYNWRTCLVVVCNIWLCVRNKVPAIQFYGFPHKCGLVWMYVYYVVK